MKAKICGITTLRDALLAIEYGAWALGFNFYSQSPRAISLEKATAIINVLPSSIIEIGIFVDFDITKICHYKKVLSLDFVQVYEDMKYINKGGMILSLSANTTDDLPHDAVLASYEYILLDAPRTNDSLLGGTGRLSNWDLARDLAKKYRLILAGGLSPHNVHAAIDYVQPFAVDVASGIESNPGNKDPVLLRQFLKGVNHDN